MLFVLLGHCTYNAVLTDYGGVDIGVGGSPYSIIQKGLCFLCTVIYEFHMPLFVALSGCLWSVHLQKKGLPSFKSVLQGKARRLLIPFLVAALLWSIPLKYISGYWADAGRDILSQIFIGQILMYGNSNSHLWFVQSLFWIFIMSWIIERFNLRRKSTVFFFCLFFISICCRYVYGKFHIELLSIILACYYLLWFYVGFYFEQYRLRFNQYISAHISWTKGVVACAIYIALIYASGKLPHIPGLSTVSIYIFAPIGMALTYALCYKSLTITKPRLLTVITYISKESYGLYLYSDPINYVVLWLVSDYSFQCIYSDNLGALSIYLVRFFASTLGAWMVILIMRKLKYKL